MGTDELMAAVHANWVCDSFTFTVFLSKFPVSSPFCSVTGRASPNKHCFELCGMGFSHARAGFSLSPDISLAALWVLIILLAGVCLLLDSVKIELLFTFLSVFGG